MANAAAAVSDTGTPATITGSVNPIAERAVHPSNIDQGLRLVRTLPQLTGASTSALLVLIAAIAVLYVGRQVFIPLALAVLLSFMLAPLVSWLQRRRVPKIPAVGGVVAVTFAVVFGFGFLVAGQVAQLAQNLPSYQSNIHNKLMSLNLGEGPNGLFAGISQMLQVPGDGSNSPPSVGTLALPPLTGQTPVPVAIVAPAPSPFQIVETVAAPLVAPLVILGIVVVVVIVILLQRQDLRDRFILLAGAADINRTTQALEDAGSRVARYLLMQGIVNLGYGVPVGVGLYLIGIPNPLLWGMLAVVLRFVPYIGPVLAATPPIALALAVDPNWTMLVWTLGLFVVLETITGNILEPWLYGARTGLSPAAIIVAAIFWTSLWGPIGLLLSTPLTVCVVVLGRHVPQFAFLNVLLGSDPVLTDQEGLHQRLLALNPDEATANAEEYLRDHSLEDFYGEVAIPALVSIEQDRAAGVLAEDRRAMVVDSITTLIDNLSEIADEPLTAPLAAAGIAATDTLPIVPVALGSNERRVLCVGGRGNLDDAAAAIVSQLLRRRGVGADTLSWVEVSPANLARADVRGVQGVCLLYLNDNSEAHARYLKRRLNRRMPGIPVVVTLFSPPASGARQTGAAAGPGGTSTTLVATLEQLSGLVGQHVYVSRPSPAAPQVVQTSPGDTARSPRSSPTDDQRRDGTPLALSP